MIAIRTLAVLVGAAAGLFAADLSVGSATAGAGSTASVSVNLRPQGAQISGIQFDLVYDKSALTVTVAAGDAATAAGKSANANDVPAGKRVVAIGFNRNSIGDGSVVNLGVKVAPGVAPGSYPITLTNVTGTTAAGQAVQLETVNGAVTVEHTRPPKRK